MDKDALLGALKSKTVWVFGTSGALGAFDWLGNNSELVTGILTALGVGSPAAVMAVLGAIGVVLRAVTKDRLSDKA
jgi:hypothetical protein